MSSRIITWLRAALLACVVGLAGAPAWAAGSAVNKRSGPCTSSVYRGAKTIRLRNSPAVSNREWPLPAPS